MRILRKVVGVSLAAFCLCLLAGCCCDEKPAKQPPPPTEEQKETPKEGEEATGAAAEDFEVVSIDELEEDIQITDDVDVGGETAPDDDMTVE